MFFCLQSWDQFCAKITNSLAQKFESCSCRSSSQGVVDSWFLELVLSPLQCAFKYCKVCSFLHLNIAILEHNQLTGWYDMFYIFIFRCSQFFELVYLLQLRIDVDLVQYIVGQQQLYKILIVMCMVVSDCMIIKAPVQF